MSSIGLISPRYKTLVPFTRSTLLSQACLSRSTLTLRHGSTNTRLNPLPSNQQQPSSLMNQQKKQQSLESARLREKSISQADEELRARLEEMSGGGGAAGIEYEGGESKGLKREVKRNMFRII